MLSLSDFFYLLISTVIDLCNSYGLASDQIYSRVLEPFEPTFHTFSTLLLLVICYERYRSVSNPAQYHQESGDLPLIRKKAMLHTLAALSAALSLNAPRFFVIDLDTKTDYAVVPAKFDISVAGFFAFQPLIFIILSLALIIVLNVMFFKRVSELANEDSDKELAMSMFFMVLTYCGTLVPRMIVAVCDVYL